LGKAKHSSENGTGEAGEGRKKKDFLEYGHRVIGTGKWARHGPKAAGDAVFAARHRAPSAADLTSEKIGPDVGLRWGRIRIGDGKGGRKKPSVQQKAIYEGLQGRQEIDSKKTGKNKKKKKKKKRKKKKKKKNKTPHKIKKKIDHPQKLRRRPETPFVGEKRAT